MNHEVLTSLVKQIKWLAGKRIILILTLFTLSSSLFAQSWLWGAQGNGAIKSNDYGGSVATDKQGNAYMTSDYMGTITFGAITLTNYYDGVYLVKYNSSGTLQWATQPVQKSGGDYSYSTSIATDKTGNVYITGTFHDTLSFGSHSLIAANNYRGDIFLVKYDANGNVLWASQAIPHSIRSGGIGSSVATDDKGNVYVTGNFDDTVSFGTYTLTSQSPYYYGDVFLVKYDSNGNILWAKQSISSPAFSYSKGCSVATDGTGNAYITGFYYDTTSFGAYTLKNPGYNQSSFLVKYDANGNVMWAEQANTYSSNDNATANSVTTDAAGGIYIAGTFQDTVGFGAYTLKSISRYSDMFLVKYDASGNVLFANQTKGSIFFSVRYPILCSDEGSHIYLTFDADSSCSFGGYNFICFNPYYYYSCMAKLNDSGRVICASVIPGSYDGVGIASDALGKYIYTAGTVFGDTLFFGPDTLMAANGGSQPYVARWQPCKTCSLTSAITGTHDICLGSSDFLSASGGNKYLWYDGETTPGISVTPSASGTYTVMVSNGSCSSVDSINITVHPGPAINVCCNSTIVPGQSASIDCSGGLTYSWAPQNGLSCTDCANPSASPNETTTYSVTITTDSGCLVTEAVTIDVNCGQVFVPDAFSPNGDGQNDVLYVRGVCINTMVFQVYDRWGNMVFESQNKNSGWDGTHNGQPMNTGTYVYSLHTLLLDGSLVDKHGNITLVR